MSNTEHNGTELPAGATAHTDSPAQDPAEFFYVEMQKQMQLAMMGIIGEGADKANELGLSIAAPAQCLGMSAASALYETLRTGKLKDNPEEFKSLMDKLGEMLYDAFTQKCDLLFDPNSKMNQLRAAADEQKQG